MTSSYPPPPPPGPQYPPPYGQPPYGQPPPAYQQHPAYPPAARSAIVLLCKASPFVCPAGLLTFMATPWVTVNGQPRRAGWGRSVIPVLPGRYEVRVYLRLAHSINSSTRFSLAQVLVPVSVAQVVELEYKAPLVFSTAGSLGPPPQKYNHLLGMFLCWGIVVAFVVLAIFAPE